MLSTEFRLFLSERGRYPNDLCELVPRRRGLDMRLFVCPATGHVSGKWSDVDVWSDYKYVRGHKRGDEGSGIALFCPAENHDGKHVNVVTLDGGVLRIEKDQFLKLVRTEYFTRIPASSLTNRALSGSVSSQITNETRRVGE